MAIFTGRFGAEEVRNLAFGSIVAGYTAVGLDFREPTSMLWIQNFTNADLMFSFDGVTDNFPIKSSTSVILDITSNKTNETNLLMPENKIIYVKRIGTPTEGSVYVTSFHG